MDQNLAIVLAATSDDESTKLVLELEWHAIAADEGILMQAFRDDMDTVVLD